MLLAAVYPEVRLAQLAELALVGEPPSLLRASLQVVALAVLAVAPLVAPLVVPLEALPQGEAPSSGLLDPLAEAVVALAVLVVLPLPLPLCVSA